MQVIKFVYNNVQKIQATMSGLSQVDSVALKHITIAKDKIAFALKKVIYFKDKVSDSVVKSDIDTVSAKSIFIEASSDSLNNVGLSSKKYTDGLQKNVSELRADINETKVVRAVPVDINTADVTSEMDSITTAFAGVKNRASVTMSLDSRTGVRAIPAGSSAVLYHEASTEALKNVSDIINDVELKNSIDGKLINYTEMAASASVISKPIEITLNSFAKLADYDNTVLQTIDDSTFNEIENKTI